MSILAGMLIAIGCILYLKVGGVVGAALFSVGLMSVVLGKLKLFTGKAGYLVEKKIGLLELLKIWVGNTVGVWIIAAMTLVAPWGPSIASASAAIMEQRQQAGLVASFVLAIPCGLLMYLAVNFWKDNLIYIAMCVMAFILCGFYHCVAEMFYASCGNLAWPHLILVTLGNFVGCSLYPLIQRCSSLRREGEFSQRNQELQKENRNRRHK